MAADGKTVSAPASSATTTVAAEDREDVTSRARRTPRHEIGTPYEMNPFNDPPIRFLLALIPALMGVGIWLSIKERRERRRKESEFVSLLLTAFENKAIATVDDLVALHDAHFDRPGSPVLVYRQLRRFLEAVQLQIASAQAHRTAHKLIPRLGELRGLTDLVAKTLATEEKRVPFYGTPEPERGLLEDILELTNSDREIVGGKLTRLAELIAARSETIKTLGDEKGKATKLAYWGLAGTLLFGILSLVVTLWSLKQGGP
jgi:hypothetical protein